MNYSSSGSQLEVGQTGRGGGIRTPTRGFGDRWSAVKPTPLDPAFSSLLDFLVHLVFAALGAEFLQFQPLRGRFLVLGVRIVPIFTLSALHGDDFARHSNSPVLGPGQPGPYSTISVTVPAPTVRPPSRMAKRRPLSMATGVINSTTSGTLSPGITISVPAGSSATPVTSVVRK